jgi:hypothetical protein
VNSSRLEDKDFKLLPEGEKGFGYSEAVHRILALEREVARLRRGFEEISAGTLVRPTESSGTVSHWPTPSANLGAALEVEPSLPFGPVDPAGWAHSAATPTAPQSSTPAEWDPRRKVACADCGKAISADSLSRHRRRVHSAASPAEEGRA